MRKIKMCESAAQNTTVFKDGEREKQPEPENDVDTNRNTETNVRETMRWKERGKGQFTEPCFTATDSGWAVPKGLSCFH